MTIGQAARASGVSVKMIRHYEAIGLLPAAARSEGGYRLFGPEDVHALRFIANARELGFPLPEIARLLELWRDRGRASAEVKRLAEAHIAAIERRVAALEAMAATLRRLAETCHGDDRPDCPILEGLASPSLTVPEPEPLRRRRSRA